jgi:hypothetical protein
MTVVADISLRTLRGCASMPYSCPKVADHDGRFLFSFVSLNTIRFSMDQRVRRRMHRGLLSICFVILISVGPSFCLASPRFLFVFIVRPFFFYFHFDDLQLVDVFLPSMLSISIPCRICTDITFLILMAVVAARCHFSCVNMNLGDAV